MSKERLKKKIREAIESDPNKDYFKSVSLFGSYLHGDQTRKSDIDLLVEFAKPLGFFEFARIERELGERIGKKVDLVTKQCLSKYFRKNVLKQAEKIYAQRG